MGRRSEGVEGLGILGIGCIIADFHCEGTVDWSWERLSRGVTRGVRGGGGPPRVTPSQRSDTKIKKVKFDRADRARSSRVS